jgi:hypothetical protein
MPYSYDRTKTARRRLGEPIDELEPMVAAAKELAQLASDNLRDSNELYRFLQLANPNEQDLKNLLNIATEIARDLPKLIRAADELDDAIDAYTRRTRRGMPRKREDVTDADLDKDLVKDLVSRGAPISKALKHLQELAGRLIFSVDVPNSDFSDSPRIERLGEQTARIDELQSELTFDVSDITDFLSPDGIKEYLVNGLNIPSE